MTEEDNKRILRQMMRPLQEVWIDIGVEKLKSHERITVKAFLDSGVTGLFADKKFIEKHGFKLEKLERPIRVTNKWDQQQGWKDDP